jgi:hypothetical protein
LLRRIVRVSSCPACATSRDGKVQAGGGHPGHADSGPRPPPTSSGAGLGTAADNAPTGGSALGRVAAVALDLIVAHRARWLLLGEPTRHGTAVGLPLEAGGTGAQLEPLDLGARLGRVCGGVKVLPVRSAS